MKKTIGIIGGMGPMATVDLMKKVILATDAREDQDHIPILVDNNTNIPDRTAAILGKGESPLPELMKSAERLTNGGADFLIMPSIRTCPNWYAPASEWLSATSWKIPNWRKKSSKEG